MQIKIDDVFSLSSGRYIALEEAFYLQDRYIFVNKLNEDDNPTNDFKVFKCVNDAIVEEKDNKKLKELLDFFSEKVNDKLALINETYENKGENK